MAGLNAPAIKEDIPDGFDEERDDPRLDQACGRRYRGVVARANYLSLDMIDLQLASKEACREMWNPRVSGDSRMKRIARNLLECRKLAWKSYRGKTVFILSRTGLHVDDVEGPLVEA